MYENLAAAEIKTAEVALNKSEVLFTGTDRSAVTAPEQSRIFIEERSVPRGMLQNDQ
jgi:hypothetical protein